MVLVDEAVGSLVAVGSHEDHEILTHAGSAVTLRLAGHIKELFAATLDAVAAGVDDKRIAQGRNLLEPAAQRVDRDTLAQHLLHIVALQRDAARQHTVLALESADLAHIHAAGHQIRLELGVAHAVAGIVHQDVHIAVLRLDDILQPVHALVIDLLAAGIVQHLHMTGGNTQRVHEILVQHIAVVAGKIAVRQRSGILLVGNNQGVSLTVDILLDVGDVEVHILVVQQGGLHILGGSVESAVHHNLQTAAAVVRTGHVKAAGHEMIVVIGALQASDLVGQEALHALGADISQLGVGGDAVFLVHRDTHILIVEDGRHIAEVAVLALVVDVGNLGGVGSRGDGDSGLLAGREDIAHLLIDHRLGQIADGAAGVGRTPQIGCRGIVVLSALEMVAGVGDIIHIVDLGLSVLGGVLHHVRSDAHEGLVVQFLGVRQVNQHLLDLLIHLFFALLTSLFQTLDDECMDVIVVLVFGLWRVRNSLSLSAQGQGHCKSHQGHDSQVAVVSGVCFHCAMNIIFQNAKLYLFIQIKSPAPRK